MTRDNRASGFPEAALIGLARRARKLTVEEAAVAAKISHQRWRQIEGSKGNRAPADTVAHMAHVVGITAERMKPIFPEAAEVLEEIELQQAAGTPAFERKVRQAISELPDPDRSIVEELYANYVDTQERNRELIDRILDVAWRRSKNDDEPPTPQEQASGG